MPNWCFNKITVRGTTEKVRLFINKYFTEGEFDFDKIIPEPKTIQECPQKYICDPVKKHIQPCEGREWFDWYTWQYDNWGTKWGACETQTDFTGYKNGNAKLIIVFDTAWCPPIPVIDKLISLEPELKITHTYECEG